jgi:hypothetical protein
MVCVTVEKTRVRIGPHAGYRDKYRGELGTIEKSVFTTDLSAAHKIGVRLDNHENRASAIGIFWFDADKLESVDVLENHESEDTRIMLKGFKVAGINFVDSPSKSVYAYALYDDNVFPGDIVVVQSGHHGIGLGRVEWIDGEMSTKAVEFGREVISKVDFTAFNERKEKAEKLEKIKAAMDEKVKELQSYAIYEMLAEKDPDLKSMLDEFKTLSE